MKVSVNEIISWVVNSYSWKPVSILQCLKYLKRKKLSRFGRSECFHNHGNLKKSFWCPNLWNHSGNRYCSKLNSVLLIFLQIGTKKLVIKIPKTTCSYEQELRTTRNRCFFFWIRNFLQRYRQLFWFQGAINSYEKSWIYL